MFAYDQPVFRPPSEARSLIFQITLGCSHNKCAFCTMYRSKKFRTKPIEQIRAEIAEAARHLGPRVARVFLADGDAMCLSAQRLIEVLDAVNERFPRLQRAGIYANARDVLRKTPEELLELRRRKLGIIYLGLESGDDETLAAIEKGAKVDEIVEAASMAKAAGIEVSVMVLIGLAGRERSLLHARLSADAVNRMEPTYTGLLTYTPNPGTPLFEKIERGEFEYPDPMESLREIREFVANLKCATYFTCNHASNYLPLTGQLPTYQPQILRVLDSALAGDIALKPEFLRGL